MTSRLRRKRLTTVPAPTTPAPTAAERRPQVRGRLRPWARFLAALLLPAALAAPALAQGPSWGPPVAPSGGARWQTDLPAPVTSLSIPPAPMPPPVSAPPLPMAPVPVQGGMSLPDNGPTPDRSYRYIRDAGPPAVRQPAPRFPAAPPPVVGGMTAPGSAPAAKTYYYTQNTGGPSGMQPTSLQKAPYRSQAPRATDEPVDYNIRLDVPGFQRVTQLESEAALIERMRQEARARGERLVFPDEPVLSKEQYLGRHWSPLTREVEPYYVMHGRLLFQQKNFERYGWDLGPISPLLSAGKFYLDVAALPYHLATQPFQQYETGAGYCLPGDPVPLLLYPPEVSVTGLAAEAAVFTALLFIFP